MIVKKEYCFLLRISYHIDDNHRRFVYPHVLNLCDYGKSLCIFLFLSELRDKDR